MIAIAIALHVLAAVVWIGGMFFAVYVLRIAAGEMDSQARLALWGRVFAKFFPWVWVAIAVLFVTGYWLVLGKYGGPSGLPLYLKAMNGLGIIMVLIFLHMWFAPYKRFRKALAAGDMEAAAKPMNQIRMIVTTNLFIGLIVVIVGASGPYWG